MKKIYNSPSIKITTYASIDSTNNIRLETSTAIGMDAEDGKIASGTYKLNDLNN